MYYVLTRCTARLTLDTMTAQESAPNASHDVHVQAQENKSVEKRASAVTQKKAKAKSKKQQVERQVAQQEIESWRPQVGDLVEVPKLGSAARVQNVKGQKVTVSLGGSMPVTVKLSDVVRM